MRTFVDSFARGVLALALVALGALAPPATAAKWTVSRVNSMVVTPPAGVTVAEMSGVTYTGPSGGGYHFITATENSGQLVSFDLSFNASGGITAINNVAAITLDASLKPNDFEGIAYTSAARHSVFLSKETHAGVMEVDLNTGTSDQVVTVPTVFTTHDVSNLGFESLTRSQDGSEMWTANEQALTVDGPLATAAAGTVVRLLKFNVSGNTVTAGPQYAYNVEPIHGSSIPHTTSGLSDMVEMPDGTLISLERSLANAAQLYLNRIYEIDATPATDVSGIAGLIGASYTPVNKQLLWSGAADGSLGQNLEGLTLGPRLANGSWVLVGVVDNGSGTDPLSQNTVVAFTATAIPSADFNGDNSIDGADFLRWQRGVGKTVGAKLADGDADRDGDVDAADLAIWKTQFGVVLPVTSVPEPAGGTLAAVAAAGSALAAVCVRGFK